MSEVRVELPRLTIVTFKLLDNLATDRMAWCFICFLPPIHLNKMHDNVSHTQIKQNKRAVEQMRLNLLNEP